MSFRHQLPLWLIAASPVAGMAADCAPQPGCQVPTACAPPVYCCPSDRSEPRQGPGNYVRGPATGEANGESNGIGIRGFGIRIPEINLRLPTVELPSLFSIRREAEFHFDGGRGPYVEGEPAEFRMVDGGPRTAPPPTPDPRSFERCGWIFDQNGRALGPANPVAPAPAAEALPPAAEPPQNAPAAPTTRRGNDIDARERELAMLRQQVAEMQAQLRDLSAPPAQPSAAVTPRSLPAAPTRPAVAIRQRIEPAAYVEDEATVEAPPVKPQPTMGLSKPGRATAPPPSRPIARSTATKAPESREFGEWSNAAKR